MSSQFEFNSECLTHLFVSVEFDTPVLFYDFRCRGLFVHLSSQIA